MAAAWAAKSTLKSYGTFSTPTFGGVGEPYVEEFRRTADSRTRGRQFTTNHLRRGQTGDNWNVKRAATIQRLFEGEALTNPAEAERKWKMEQKKKQ